MESPIAERTAPRLFISYSHDSREHEDRVRALADRLRKDGVDALIDQYDLTPPDGWPMWMDRAIQKADFIALVCTETYFRRVEGHESPGKGRGVLWEAKLIYNLFYGEDTSFQRFIPILLDDGSTSSIPLPIRGLTRYQTDTAEGYEEFYRHLLGQPRHEKPALGKLKPLPAMAPQSYPASLKVRTERKAPSSLDQRNRLQMLKRVRLDWIEGVLKQSLYEVARIELGLQTKPEAVEKPLRALVQTLDQLPATVPAGTPINQVFDDHAGALLILGAPGTGKTTLLLELAQDLINRAEHDEHHLIPVVFNLSSWAVRRAPLDQWLISELNERSDVPKILAQRWVETEQIIPLLDGLDEVGTDHRQSCVDAINTFRRDHGLLPIAVCSRIADYEALGTKLRLQSAIIVQPLTKSEVLDYLERSGEPMRELRAALKRDALLWELLQTPLMLWVGMLTYNNVRVQFFAADNLKQRRRRLFANFVDAMFKRRSRETRYTRKQTLSWLCWLASAMSRNEQTSFYLEDLREAWLPTRLKRWSSRAWITIGSGVIGGLVGGLIGVAIEPLAFPHFALRLNIILGWGYGTVIGTCVGLVAGIVSAFVDLRPVETIQIGLASISSRLRSAVRISLVTGLSSGLIFALIIKLAFGQSDRLNLKLNSSHWLMFTGFTPLQGFANGFVLGLAFGLLRLVTGQRVETRTNPNQGTHRSRNLALVTGLIFGLVGVLIAKLAGWGEGALVPNGVAGALAFGMVLGGIFSIKHFVLRLMLWATRSAPYDYVRFLDYAVDRLFLRKVGGGYIFVHRMLLEYFASLPKQPSFNEGAVRSKTSEFV